MELRVMKKGFNYSQDGRGNRLVYHLQGCNMRCRWCSNPESMAVQGVMMLTGTPPESCCPFGAIENGTLNRALCTECTQRPCLQQRRSKGLQFSCKSIPLEELLQECEDSRPLHFDGGGITLSGGEPTLQFAGVRQLLEGLRERGVHTAMETNGTHPQLAELFPLIDQLIMDLKHPDPEIHKQFTGLSNEATMENLKQAFALHPNLLVRTPLIQGVNTDEAALQGFLRFYAAQDTARADFELLKYHEYGSVKWGQCGMEYQMHDGSVEEETRLRFEEAYRAQGLRVVRT